MLLVTVWAVDLFLWISFAFMLNLAWSYKTKYKLLLSYVLTIVSCSKLWVWELAWMNPISKRCFASRKSRLLVASKGDTWHSTSMLKSNKFLKQYTKKKKPPTPRSPSIALCGWKRVLRALNASFTFQRHKNKKVKCSLRSHFSTPSFSVEFLK